MRRRAARDVDAEAPRGNDADDLGDHRERSDPAEPGIAREAASMLLHLDVEHHDDEQEQHHHRSNVDKHQHDREELGLDQQPDRRARDEAQHQKERRMHRILRDDHRERRGDQDRRKHVKTEFRPACPALPIAARF